MPAAKVKSQWDSSGSLSFKTTAGAEVATLDASGMLRGPGIARTIRSRFTIAQVNAGATILAAVAGRKYRLIDALAIAVGGAVGATTTVDILGTQATSSVKLAAFAQASMTQSTVLRPGVSGTTVLADGASFVQNDVNTAITINKTGATATTATHVDVVLTYALEE